MDLFDSTRSIGGNPTVVFEGVVDLASIGRVHDVLHRAVLDHPGALVIVDLDGVSSLDDSGLGIILGAAAAARQRGGDIELVCTSTALLDRFALTRLDQLLTIRSTVA